MPANPSLSEVHIDKPLTNFALQYKHGEYLNYQIAPVVPVRFESDQYYIFNEQREDIIRPNALRAVGDRSNEIKFGVATDTYTAEEYALHYALADRIRDNQEDVMRLRERGTKQVLDQLMLDKELRLQALYQTFGGAGQIPGADVSTKWDDTDPDPEGDIQAAKSIIRRTIGREPTHILMSVPVADALVRYLKAVLTALDLKTKLSFVDLPNVLWGLKVLIGKGVYRTSNPGQPIDVPTDVVDIWGDNVVVFYQEEGVGVDSMSLMKTFQKRPFMTKTWREEARATEMIEVSHVEVEKLTAPIAGYVLGDTLL
jgi:hypothetical protein